MPSSRLLEEGDELALPWDDLADGRAWPLVRGRDFFLNPKEVEEAARNAAGRIGKAVATLRTLRASVVSIWVQFADYQIEPGMPCPCGSDDLRRINDAWAICATCGSTLLVDTRPKGSGAASSIVVDASQTGDDDDEGTRLRIFVPEGVRMGNERKRLAALRDASGDGAPKPKPAAERKEAAVREREEKKEAQAREREEKKAQALERQEAQAREREEKKAQIRQKRDDTRRQRQQARTRSREQQQQRREAERDAGGSGQKQRTPAPTEKPPTRPQQSSSLTLDRFTNVRLWTTESQLPGRFWGCGYDRKGRFVLLEVTLQLTGSGEPMEDPAQPGRVLHNVSAVRSAPFAAAVDADALLARTDGLPPEKVLSLAPR